MTYSWQDYKGRTWKETKALRPCEHLQMSYKYVLTIAAYSPDVLRLSLARAMDVLVEKKLLDFKIAIVVGVVLIHLSSNEDTYCISTIIF